MNLRDASRNSEKVSCMPALQNELVRATFFGQEHKMYQIKQNGRKVFQTFRREVANEINIDMGCCSFS